MNKNRIIFGLLIFVLISSCERHTLIRFGFDSKITEDSKGLVIMGVSDSANRILLNGHLRLTEGKVELRFLNPDGEIVYFRTVNAPGEVTINEAFDVLPGFWKLKYTSIEGRGEINLHCYN